MDRNPSNKTDLSAWEDHLVDRAQRGERVAFALLVDLHRPAVVGQAMRMLRDPEDAQDAVQETFLKACKAIQSFQKGRPMLPWLLRICSNCCVDIIRARRAPVESLESHEHALYDQNADVASDLESSWGSQSLRDAIVRLPMRYREIVVMRHYRHMDVNEIAVALGKPEGTIKSWLFRARALLKKDLTTAMAS
ncbi:RNA polymerase sigma factor [Kamptonema cortianum]|nr:RNA polymerase sigma factor [Geitlerinema splendidum]MDK3155939.1 RNA polymerase sigma factor [Kamptonema cortianum]